MANHTNLTPAGRLVRLLGQYKREIRYVILYAVVIGLINLTLPLGVQAIIGLIAGGSMAASWGVLILFILVGALLAGLLRLAQLALMENLQRRIFTDVAIDFAIRIPRFHLDRLRKEHLPELVNRFFDTLTLQKGLPKVLTEGSTALLQIFFSLLLLSFYSVSFVILSLLMLGIIALLMRWTGPRGLQTSLSESKYKYQLAYWLEEVGRVAGTFQLAGQNRFPVQRADELTAKYLDARERHWRVLVLQFIGSIGFRLVVLGGFLILGSLLVLNGQLNIGQFVASEILVFYVIESLEKILLLLETGYDILTAIEKIGQVTDLPLEREDGIAVDEFVPQGEAITLETRHLSYRFNDGGPQQVLQDINLNIPAGQRIAVAGYNGSGKSTFLQVVAAQKSDFEGVLLYNGLPRHNLQLRSLRENIGDVSAQEDIFKGTLEENISLGREQISLNRLMQVIEQVGLTDYIQQLPKGIHSELLPGGKNLARSIRTKILVARAIVSDPKMVVMEENLSNLNLHDRLQIGRLLVDRNRAWTLICVTEDPIMAALCDRVLVMENGVIVFDGDYDSVRNTEHYDHIFRSGELPESPLNPNR